MGTEYQNYKIAGDNNDYENTTTVNPDNTVTWSSVPPTGEAYLASFVSPWQITFTTDDNGVPTSSSVGTPVWSGSSGFWFISESKSVIGYGSGTVGDLNTNLDTQFGFYADNNNIYAIISGVAKPYEDWGLGSSGVAGSGTTGNIVMWSGVTSTTTNVVNASFTDTEVRNHLDDSTIHFTEGSIDHGSISGLADDDHPQYAGISQTETITGDWTLSGTTIVKSLYIDNQGTGDNPLLSANASTRVLSLQGDLSVSDYIEWLSEVGYSGLLYHANTAHRTYTFPALFQILMVMFV